MKDTFQIMIAMGVYMLIVIGIGIIFAKRANKKLGSLFYRRPDPGSLGHRHERGSVGYVRLAADGPARRRLLVRRCGCHVDRFGGLRWAPM